MNSTTRRFRPRVELLEAREVPSTFTVTRLADDTLAGSLRWAITQANQTPGDDIIDFQPGLTGTINLAGALPNVSTNIDLRGPGAAALTVRRNTDGFYRIFTVTSGTIVSISGLTVANGLALDDGGGIFNQGTLTVSNSTISGNHLRVIIGGITRGGGIFNQGTLTVSNSTISGNRSGSFFGISSGGGIFNQGTLTVSNSTISGNHLTVATEGWISGGGISNRGTATVNSSTISGNSVHGGRLMTARSPSTAAPSPAISTSLLGSAAAFLMKAR